MHILTKITEEGLMTMGEGRGLGVCPSARCLNSAIGIDGSPFGGIGDQPKGDCKFGIILKKNVLRNSAT